MLNPLHLRTLNAVVQTGSFAAAAKMLGYTSSAVSQHIVALERETHLTLFERHARGIVVTPLAVSLASRADDVLRSLAALDDEVRSLADATQGRLRVGSFPTASQHLLPAALATIAAERPGVTVELDEGEPAELVPRVHDGELDVAIVYRYSRVPVRQVPTLDVLPLLTEQLLLMLPAGHALAGQSHLRLEQLADETWITTRVGTGGATCLERICADAGFAPLIAHRSNDYDVVRGFVRSGLGVALVPTLGWSPDDGVVARQVETTPAHRYVEAVYRSDARNPAVPPLLAALAASAAA